MNRENQNSKQNTCSCLALYGIQFKAMQIKNYYAVKHGLATLANFINGNEKVIVAN